MENKRKNSAENKKHLNIQEIKEIIPHRHPFLLIDYVEDYEPVSYTHLDVYKRQAYAYADFHRKFIRNHITVIGCPKLDEVDYTAKLTEIIMNNEIKRITIVRMEVPCCGGIERAVVNAMKASGKFLPWQVYVISTDGKILER